VAVGLIFFAVAHQRDGAPPTKFLKQAQGEFLSMVLDEAVAPIYAATLLQLRAIAPCKLAPTNPLLLSIAEQRFTWPEVGHPHVISALRQASPSNTGHKDTQAVLAWFYG